MSPLYDLRCECGYTTEVLWCGYTTEVLLGMKEKLPDCLECGKELERVYSAPPMVKMKGEGGYPSRRRQVFNTTKNSKPQLDSKATKEAAKERRI